MGKEAKSQSHLNDHLRIPSASNPQMVSLKSQGTPRLAAAGRKEKSLEGKVIPAPRLSPTWGMMELSASSKRLATRRNLPNISLEFKEKARPHSETEPHPELTSSGNLFRSFNLIYFLLFLVFNIFL